MIEVHRGDITKLVTREGSRLSIQPVTKPEYDIMVKLGRGKKK